MAAVQPRSAPGPWPGRDSAAPALGLPARRPASPVPAHRPRPTRRLPRRVHRELGAILLAAALAGGAVAGSVAVVQESFLVQRVGATVAGLQDENGQLAAEYAVLQNPQRIAGQAVDSLGMRQPAGYVPVPVQGIPPAAAPAPAQSVVAVLPVAGGPAPGGAVAITRGVAGRGRAVLAGLRGLLRRA